MISIIRQVLRVAVLPALLAVEAGAQNVPETPDEGSCRTAADVVQHARDARAVALAYVTFIRCPNAGEVLARLWATPPADADALAQLALRSTNVSDRRILTATLALVRDPGTKAEVRRAALDVVLAQYRPSVAVGTRIWADPEHTSLSALGHWFQLPGAQAVTEADRAAVIDTFRQLSVSEAGTQWGRVAKRIANDLPTAP